MQRPRVSVLLPVHDAESTLPAALESVARQLWKDWECVIVDDGSADATPRMVQQAAASDARFRAVRVERGGIVAALRAGLAACRGELVARMDGDDIMHRRRLERQVAALEARSDLAGVGCHVRLFPRSSLSDGRRAYERWLNSLRTAEDVARERFIECPLAHPTWLVRRTALEELEYRNVGWPEDYDWLLRLHATGARLGVVPERLLFWRDSPRRLSRIDPTYGLPRFVACKAHYLKESFLGHRRSYVLWGYGDTGRALCRALERLSCLPSHIVELHPGRIGQRVAGAPVIRPESLAALTPRPDRVVVSVAGLRARSEIRAWLGAAGFVEGEDYVCAA